MADQKLEPQELDPKGRKVGNTEYSWCRAIPGGTGITVLALLLSKPPDTAFLQNALQNVQISHPILRSKLTYSTTTSANPFAFTIPDTPHLQIQSFDISTTSHLLQTLTISQNDSISSFHRILEYELNQNIWSRPEDSSSNGTDVMCATVYALENAMWVLAVRLHTSVCDNTSAVSLLTELLGSTGERETITGDGEVKRELGKEEEFNLGIEDLIPSGKANKPFWARGVDLLGYSLNSLRFANLEFKDPASPRSSVVVRLQMSTDETDRVLSGCNARGIKLCGAIAAAALISAYSSKNLPNQQSEKYAVTTLVDCRKLLDPPLHTHNLGFYYSAILNTHDIDGRTVLWDLASRCYMAFTNAMNSNKHFTDMGDLNFLMCKAIENPGMTPSSSLRTSLICVFEDPVIDNSSESHQEFGLEDYIGCSSVHGVGPSVAVFDTIRNGRLDCACVCPIPLHSREQMQELIDQMKRILIDGCD